MADGKSPTRSIAVRAGSRRVAATLERDPFICVINYRLSVGNLVNEKPVVTLMDSGESKRTHCQRQRNNYSVSGSPVVRCSLPKTNPDGNRPKSRRTRSRRARSTFVREAVSATANRPFLVNENRTSGENRLTQFDAVTQFRGSRRDREPGTVGRNWHGVASSSRTTIAERSIQLPPVEEHRDERLSIGVLDRRFRK